MVRLGWSQALSTRLGFSRYQFKLFRRAPWGCNERSKRKDCAMPSRPRYRVRSEGSVQLCYQDVLRSLDGNRSTSL